MICVHSHDMRTGFAHGSRSWWFCTCTLNKLELEKQRTYPDQIPFKKFDGRFAVFYMFDCETRLWDEHDFLIGFLIRAYIARYTVLTPCPHVELGIPRSQDVETSCRMKVIRKSQGDRCCTTKCCCADPGFNACDGLFFGFIFIL